MTTTTAGWALPWDGTDAAAARADLALVVAWSLEEPERMGETARVTHTATMGRATEGPGAVQFARERPGSAGSGAPLNDGRISRKQLLLTPIGAERLRVENVGKCPLLVNGVEIDAADVSPGDTVTLKNAVVLLVTRRSVLPPLRSYPARFAFPFGFSDPHGIVGESPAAWSLRDELSLAAASASHVLVHGPSGSGKELCARAIHALSSRSANTFLARNAATFPSALIDAELFGNVKNYPNPGMPERKGLIGESHEGTLFLDEIGELPAALQAHFLRVLDSSGEYQRLGESRTSRADLRVVAATNRPIADLKDDFLARFAARIELPSLAARREDIPLLVRHLLARRLAETPSVGRFFQDTDRGSVARVEPSLVEGLLRHRYTHELRELDRLLWLAIGSSPGQFIAASPAVLEALDRPGSSNDGADAAPELDRATIEAALAKHDDSVTEAARALGLRNRFVLYRLMKRHGIGG